MSQVTNLSNPGQVPVDGDLIRIEHPSGATEEKQFWTPIPPPPPSAEYVRGLAKAERARKVSEIKVTTTAGNTFDGDEDSQGRMARAIIGLSTGVAVSMPWVLADNSVIEATASELTEALVLAGQAQSALWVLPS